MDRDYVRARSDEYSAPSPEASEQRRALIAVIDPASLSRLDTEGLRSAGYDVKEVTEATSFGDLSSPDLIVMPFSPSADEALARCRQLRTAAPTAVPIMVVTRFDDLYIREQIVRSGATAILVEPLKHSFVLRQVRRLLARSKLHRQR
jgi:DNA-binding response OmpR family regulator